MMEKEIQNLFAETSTAVQHKAHQDGTRLDLEKYL